MYAAFFFISTRGYFQDLNTLPHCHNSQDISSTAIFVIEFHMNMIIYLKKFRTCFTQSRPIIIRLQNELVFHAYTELLTARPSMSCMTKPLNCILESI
jgi:hypothetical protein